MKKLYKILLFTLFLLTLIGCSYKNSTISIEPYRVNFISFKNYNKKIYINSIKDKRPNKQIVAVITNNNGENLGYTTTTTNFVKWYKEALSKAFKAGGLKISQNKKKVDLSIDLTLKNLMVTFNKSILTKENLTGNISLELIIKKGNEIITKNISENLSKYNGITVSQDTIKKMVQTLLNDSVKMIVKNISDI